MVCLLCNYTRHHFCRFLTLCSQLLQRLSFFPSENEKPGSGFFLMVCLQTDKLNWAESEKFHYPSLHLQINAALVICFYHGTLKTDSFSPQIVTVDLNYKKKLEYFPLPVHRHVEILTVSVIFHMANHLLLTEGRQSNIFPNRDNKVSCKCLSSVMSASSPLPLP